MKTRMLSRSVSREALAQHLREAELLYSEAVGEACVYHCRRGKVESMAIALPGDCGLIVELAGNAPALERRRRRRTAAAATES